MRGRLQAIAANGPIRFSNRDTNARFPIDLPHPALLRVHHAIAEILHASGAGKMIEDILEEFEEIHQLESNGSTDVEKLLPMAFSRNAVSCC